MIPASSSDRAASPVLEFITERTGLVFDEFRRESAEQRVVIAMNLAGITDPAGFLLHLLADGSAENALVGDLVIGETYFYREPALFDYLWTTFLPRIRREKGPDHMLRVWSAGCGSGEEAYSLAMMLEEFGLGDRSMVIGTDVSLASLNKAQRAVYGPWSFRGTDAAVLTRHFSADGGRFSLSQVMRDRVRFEPHNLAGVPFPVPGDGAGAYDLILCRNVLIYLSPPVIDRVAIGLYGALTESGLLCTGPADPALGRSALLSQVPSDQVIMYERARPGQSRMPVAPEPGPRRTGRPRYAEHAPVPAAVPPVIAVREGAGDPEALLMARIHAQTNRDGAAAAVAAAGRARLRFPASVELPFLQAVVLAGSGRHAEAVAAARNALYLDRGQPAVHFVLGASLWNLGDLEGARRGFRNAYELARALPATAVVPFTEGETADRVARGAATQLAMLAVAAPR